MTTNINDNVVQVKFNTPIETDYVVITSLQFPKFETWGWPSVTEMVYNKTSTGFTMDVWNSHQEYQHIQCTINWIAIPLQHSVSLTTGTCKGANGWVVQTGAITRTENCVTMWVDVVAGSSANKNVNVTFATMPSSFAPKTYDIELPVLGFTTTSYPISFWIRITTSGEIKIKQYVLPSNTVLGQIKCCCTYLKI